MEHHRQHQCLLLRIDHHQKLGRPLTLCHTNGLHTNLHSNIAWTNHQHIIPLNSNHNILDHLHLKRHNNMAIHLLDLEMSQRIVLLPRPTRPQAATTHRMNFPQRLQPRLTTSRGFRNYRH